jgi:hypothetical protein
MIYRHPGGLELAIGTFDDRSDLAPQVQVNYGARIPGSRRSSTSPSIPIPDFYARQEAIISFQHPDHDTNIWPARGVKI